MLATPSNTYADGIIKPQFANILSHETEQGNARSFMAGDKLWVCKFMFERKGAGVVVEILSEPINGVRFRGTLKFPFDKQAPMSSDQFLKTFLEVFTPGEAAQIPSTKIASVSNSAGAIEGLSATISIAGVRLGMTPTEAIDALKHFDSWPYLKERYASGTYVGWMENQLAHGGGASVGLYGMTGTSNDCRPIPPRPLSPVLVAIIAAKGPRLHQKPPIRESQVGLNYTPAVLAAMSDCDWNGLSTNATLGEDPMEVVVYLSPTPGTEHVIGVSLWRPFGKSPTVDSLLATAKNKYTFNVTSAYDDGANTYLSWRFNSQGQLFPETAVENPQFLPRASANNGPALPVTISPREGVGLDFIVSRLPRNRELAGTYGVSLYRQSEVFAFTAQVRSAQAAVDAKRKQEEIDKANKTSSPIKF